MRIGLQAFRTSSTDSTLEPLQLSPQPTRPSSVVSLTITSVTPSRLTWALFSRCVYGTLTIVYSACAMRTLLPPPVSQDRPVDPLPRTAIAWISTSRPSPAMCAWTVARAGGSCANASE